MGEDFYMIVIFGSINVDILMEVDKMPQPGSTVVCPSYQMLPGGKGANQAAAIAKAGSPVKLFGKIGDDSFGHFVLDSLKASSIDLTGVSMSPGSTTGCAMVCVDSQGENMISVAAGANFDAREAQIPSFLLTKETTLLLQMETNPEENWKLIRRAKKGGARIILNLAPAQSIPKDVLQSLDVLVLNQNEANLLALHLGFDVVSPTVAARRIAANYGITCIVTLGKQGAMSCSPEGTWEVKAMEVETIDTTASEDAFVGVLAASLEKDLSLPVTLRRASTASGLGCLQNGAQSSFPSETEIESNLKRVPLPRQIA
jgi:ribokinase